MKVDVFSDAICPWCYLGVRRLAGAVKLVESELGLKFDFAPFELNPDMPPEGMDRRAYRSAKFGSWERSQELDAKTEAAAAQDGIEFRYDLMERTPNTLASHRLVWLAKREGRGVDVAERILRGYFAEGRDIGSVDVLGEIADEAGMDGASVASALAGREGLDEIRAAEASARRMGVNGVPLFVLNGRYGLSGAKPADVLAAACRRAAQERPDG